MCRSVSLFDGNAAYTLQILIYSAKGGVNKRRFDMVAGMTLPSLLKPVTLIPPPPPPPPPPFPHAPWIWCPFPRLREFSVFRRHDEWSAEYQTTSGRRDTVLC